MQSNSNASGCFIILAIAIGLAFWRFSLVLIFIVILVATVSYLQNQVHLDDANKWLKYHRSWPCVYSGKYGFVDGVGVERQRITLSLKPVKALLPGSSAPFDTFTIKITDGSFHRAMRQLFTQNSIEFLQGVSVELSAIHSVMKCQEQFSWCIESMNSLVKMSDQVNRALSLAPGNPLLEPSIPALEEAKARITKESFSITEAKEFALDTLKHLIDYLSVPEEVRQLSPITELESVISFRHDELRSSFDELLEFNHEYVKLIQ